MLDSVKGNFTHVAQRDGKFPIDDETFEYIKNNATLMAALGNALGENFVILNGCTVSGNTRSEGYVYVHLTPEGAILHFPGGNANQAYCHIQSSPVDVTAHGEPYSGAYNVCSLANGMHPSDSSLTMQWANFKIGSEIFARKSHTHTIADILNLQTELDKKLPITTHNTDLNNINTTITKLQNQVNNNKTTTIEDISNINNEITEINEDITAINTNITKLNNAISTHACPKGSILLWSGHCNDIPNGWALCDGQNGRPDLRGRFVLGASEYYDQASGIYKRKIDIGEVIPYVNPDVAHSTGGCCNNDITLDVSNIPAHRHYLSIKTSIDTPANKDGFPDKAEHNNGVYWRGQSSETKSITGYTDYSGQGKSFSVPVTPPFYALCYIIKIV